MKDLYGTSKIHFYFGRPLDPLGALVAAAVPKALAASNGHISPVQALFLSSDNSIGTLRVTRGAPVFGPSKLGSTNPTLFF